MNGEPSTSHANNSLAPVVPVAERRLFVGNLGTDDYFTDDQLKRFYSKYGPLSKCGISIDRRTGKSRGFGFVTFEHVHSADQALEALPHFIIDRRVTVSRMKSESTVLEPLIRKMTSKQLYVCHTPGVVTEDQLRAHFSQFGNVVDVDQLRNVKSNESLGYSMISFDDPRTVEYCLRVLDNHRIGDCQLHIRKSVTAEAIKKAQQSERERLEYEQRYREKGSSRFAQSGDRHTSFLRPPQRHAPPAPVMNPIPVGGLAGYEYQPSPTMKADMSRDQRLAALYDTSALYPRSQE